MQSHRRVSKRSIPGTRVCARWSDGRFYSGTVDSTMSEQPKKQSMFNVLFDDGYSKFYHAQEIIGPGFSTTNGVGLKHGQKVYLTYRGHEVQGTVVKHNKFTNEVLVELQLPDMDIIETVKSLDEIRLLEEQKTFRPQYQDNNRTRSSSESDGIDVPITRNRRRRKHDEVVDENEIDMDMQIAARALQNLSCSPASPNFPLDLSRSPQSWNELIGCKACPSPPCHSQFSSSAPNYGFYGSASTDEGIDVDDTMYAMDDLNLAFKRRKGEEKHATKTRYVCTWKGCGIKMDDCKGIETHIRQVHLGQKESSELSDHEEEFYYEEIEEPEVDAMTLNFTNMYCASPVQSLPLNLSLHAPNQPMGNDHDYQRKEVMSQVHNTKTSPIVIPAANVPKTNHFFPQNSPYGGVIQKTPNVATPTSASPKHTGRKARSDVKKCRKVYGMENRDLWCTQCKWKKACTRFVGE